VPALGYVGKTQCLRSYLGSGGFKVAFSRCNVFAIVRKILNHFHATQTFTLFNLYAPSKSHPARDRSIMKVMLLIVVSMSFTCCGCGTTTSRTGTEQLSKAESTSSNTWILGAGPFQRGSIHEGVRFAGRKIDPPPLAHAYRPFESAEPDEPYIPDELHYDQAFLFKKNPGPEEVDNAVQQASFEEDVDADTKDTKAKKAETKKAAAKK